MAFCSLFRGNVAAFRLGRARSFYPVRYERVTVVDPLAHLIRRVATVDYGHHQQHGQQEEHEEADDKERQYGADQGVSHEDHDPRYLVPECLQGVEAHLLGTVLVDQPYQQRSERHEAYERQKHAQVGEYGPGLLVLRAHRLRAGMAGVSLSLLAARVGILLHRLSFRSSTRPPCTYTNYGHRHDSPASGPHVSPK